MRDSSIHGRFIRSVHRRLIIIRFVENLGGSLAFASVISLTVLSILIYRDQSILPLIAVMGTIATMISVLLTIKNWPTHLSAAADADRQLRLADLLSTAISISKTGSFADAVLSSADARCRLLSPSSVILNRFGFRAWGGIGLSVAMVLALALIPVRPSSSVAQSQSPMVESAVSNFQSQTSDADSKVNLTPRGRDDGRGQSSEENFTAKPPHGIGSESKNFDGGGGTSASSNSKMINTRISSPGSLPKQSDSHSANSGIRNGSGQESTTAVPGNTKGFSDSSSGAEPPPWETDQWRAAQQAAENAIETNQIPDRYRDITHRYFHRNQPK